MKGSTPRRLLLIALVTGLLTIGVFAVAFYVRRERELHPPPPEATTADAIQVLPGFKVDLVHSATTNEGSWISITSDPQGRLIISPHSGNLLRMTVAGGKLARVEQLNLPCTDAMGLLYASNSLFLDCNGPEGVGLYRAPDCGETFGPPVLLRRMKFSVYDHGAHAVVLGPDGKLYLVAGDSTEMPADVLTNSPLQNCADDQLLPRENDPHSLLEQSRPLGGFALRMDLDGTHCEWFAAGTRNTYALAFNSEGDLFGADNDMDWEWGTAWYRPCRFDHWMYGGDYGYRQGTGKTPDYDQDILPPTRYIGLGAPTGVKFPPAYCTFPPAYRNACFVQDWAFGRLMAVHLRPQGASYEATMETVLRGKPLTMTALEFGRDGSLYFIIGGRETESGLYRLSYVGPVIPERAKTTVEIAREQSAQAARNLRLQLESFYSHRDPSAPDVLWFSLSNPDRWIRYTARVALELQDMAWWKNRALAETNIDGGLTALLALARCGGRDTQADLLGALEKFPFAGLTQEQALLKLRVLELSFIRQGHPPPNSARHVTETLDSLYPAVNINMNQELCQLLLYLQAPDTVAKTMLLLDKAPTQEEQTYYIMRLRNITNGWTLPLRKDYFGWFQKKRDRLAHRPEVIQDFHNVGLEYTDGSSFPLFLDNFGEEATATLNPGERLALADFLPQKRKKSFAPANGKFVMQWRMTDLEPDLAMLKWRRSLSRGRAIFNQLGCVLCHRFDSHGGSVGPDLTAVANRMTGRDILESIVEPSKVLPAEYQNILLTLKDGDVLAGRVAEENKQRLVLMTDLLQRATVEIARQDVVSRRPSKISPMPEGLLNSLTEEKIWDLIAYLQSSGKTNNAGPAK